MKIPAKTIALLIITFCFPLFLNAQKITIQAENKPLNLLLIELHDTYSTEFSFDDDLLSEVVVNIDSSFNSIEDAISYLLKDTRLVMEKAGQVYLIIPAPTMEMQKEIIEPPVVKEYMITGRVVDKTNSEGLPFAQIKLNNTGLITDYNGSFSYRTKRDSTFNLTISYLGYYILDTLLQPGIEVLLQLIPSSIGLKEIVVEGQDIEYGLQVSEKPGEYKLNHKVAVALPGYGDNSVYNMLRLQPGILAAGEQSNDIIIWGSYESHSQVCFDGFTIHGLKNYNDNIGAINPYMVKDIQVLKGGYKSSYGERVGGIVDITGIEGNKIKPALNITINNNTINGNASVPLFKKNSLTVAFRQTYYNLYSADDINTPRIQDNNNVNVTPRYVFRDANVKFAGHTENGDNYYISLQGGKDYFNYDVFYERPRKAFQIEQGESNNQLAGAASYNKKWNSGARTNLLLAHSSLQTSIIKKSDSTLKRSNQTHRFLDDYTNNTIHEQSIKLSHRFVANNLQQLEIGGGYFNDLIGITLDSLSVRTSELSKNTDRLFFYINDNIYTKDKLKLDIGMRVNYPLQLKKAYIQPRFNASYEFFKDFKIKAAWGMYNQFIVKTTDTDDLGNVRYLWTVCDNEHIPVLKSIHYVGGICYSKNDFIVNVEGFYKTINGLSRVIVLGKRDRRRLNQTGDGISKGLDFFVKRDFKKISLWTSYTLSNTVEKYLPSRNPGYRRALHDQQHEWKIAGVINYKRFYLSSNYVYGSGFPDPAASNDNNDLTDTPYKRLDASVVYRFNTKLFNLETGVSILNVLNHENIKYDNFVRVPNSQIATINIHTEAIPFTPTLFLKIGI
ncbi:MAG: TonB-dependent receptor [Bacteroidales bacterium]|nr:TonB-dependent receptor [Bacteroidales bacterium]